MDAEHRRGRRGWRGGSERCEQARNNAECTARSNTTPSSNASSRYNPRLNAGHGGSDDSAAGCARGSIGHSGGFDCTRDDDGDRNDDDNTAVDHDHDSACSPDSTRGRFAGARRTRRFNARTVTGDRADHSARAD